MVYQEKYNLQSCISARQGRDKFQVEAEECLEGDADACDAKITRMMMLDADDNAHVVLVLVVKLVVMLMVSLEVMLLVMLVVMVMMMLVLMLVVMLVVILMWVHDHSSL